MPTVIPFIVAGAAAVGAVSSVVAMRDQRKASKAQQRAQRKQAEANKRIADIRAQRERVTAARKKRRAIATAQAAEQSSGVTTTATSGFIGSVNSQSASASQRGSAVDSLNAEVSIFNQQQSQAAQGFMDSSGRASEFGDIAKGVGTVSSMFQKT